MAVKCATITPNAQRVEEYKLTKMWKSPNGTIRAMLDGTVFRAPILVKGMSPAGAHLEKAHHHRPPCLRRRVQVTPRCACPGPRQGRAGLHRRRRQRDPPDHLRLRGRRRACRACTILDGSIASFARSCFQYALDIRQDLWFSTKDTISKTYDHRFKDIFQEIFDARISRNVSRRRASTYFYTLIDDAVARVIRSEGGFIWACKNYDGDVMSDMVATAFGSLAMMTSVLVSPDGKYEYEAAHGTVTRHYYRYLKGEETSTNPVATIFAWTRRAAQARRAGSAARPDDLCRPAGKGYPRHHQRRHHDQGSCPALRGRGSCRQQQGVSTGNSGTDVKKHVFFA